jgi:hypothetical protein
LFKRLFVLSLLLAPACAQTPAKNPQPYCNKLWHFSISVPQGWHSTEMFAGKSLRMTPPGWSINTASPWIMASGFRQMERHGGDFPGNNGPHPLGPDDMLEEAVGALKDHMVKDLTVSSREQPMWGLDALVSDIAYEQDGVRWRSTQIRAMRKDNTVLELILTAPAGQYASASQTFNAVVRSFAPSCDARQSSYLQPESAP